MPNYTNPYYQSVMAPYTAGYVQNQIPVQQSYAPTPTVPPMQSNVVGYQVDGEMAAKAYMIPAGTAGPIALWDLNENVFYMRSFNSAGMPNPLKKYRFYEEEINAALPNGQSGATQVDTDKFVTRDDFESLRQEIRQLSSAMQNFNSSSSSNQSHGNQNGRNNERSGNATGRQ